MMKLKILYLLAYKMDYLMSGVLMELGEPDKK